MQTLEDEERDARLEAVMIVWFAHGAATDAHAQVRVAACSSGRRVGKAEVPSFGMRLPGSF